MIRKDKNENASPAKDNVPPAKGDKNVATKKPATGEAVTVPAQTGPTEEHKPTSKK